MIGEVHFICGESYVEVNEGGTLQKLWPLRWWEKLYIYIYTRLRKRHPQEVILYSLQCKNRRMR